MSNPTENQDENEEQSETHDQDQTQVQTREQNQKQNQNQGDSPEQEQFDRTLDAELEAAIYAFINSSVESSYAAEHHSANTIFETLTNPGRRYVLTYLLQSEGFVTVSDLVDYVTTRTDTSMTNRGFRRKVTVELSHTHLPRLEDSGFVEYNMERQLVTPTELTRLTEPYLRIALAQQKLASRRKETS